MKILENYELKGYSYKNYSFSNLKEGEFEIPVGKNHPGAFGFKRKYHTHEGVDLYCKEGTKVLSITKGVVVDIGWFTGSMAPDHSDWWNNTMYISVATNNHVLLYGELIIHLAIGDTVNVGDFLGTIKQVLKTSKNSRPTSMLHFEVHTREHYTEPKEWVKERPKSLVNPIPLLASLITSL